MNGKQIILYDFEDLPHGTKVTIILNKTASMRAVRLEEILEQKQEKLSHHLK